MARGLFYFKGIKDFDTELAYKACVASATDASRQIDDYMKLVWKTYGKTQIPYTITNLHTSLNAYAGKAFGDDFFNKYIHKSGMPEMKRLFETVGVSLTQDDTKPSFGASVRQGKIYGYTTIGSSSYDAGLENGDTIIQIGDYVLSDDLDFNTIITKFKAGNTKLLGFFVGQVLKATGGKANPKVVNELVEQKLK